MNSTAPQNTRRPHVLRTALPLLAWLLALTGGLVASAEAHLSIIREGKESAGTYGSGHQFGAAMAAGDFNGDGFEDLATAAPHADGHGPNTGSVIINWGSENGLTHLGSVSLDAGDFGVSSTRDAQFGFALAAGDVNGNGFDDLVVAAPWEDVGGQVDAGRIYYYIGTENGLVPGAPFVQEDFDGISLSNEIFGHALLIQDFNSDGQNDLVVGSPGETRDRGGVIFIVNGTNFGPFGGSRIVTPGSLGYSSQPDQFGYSLAAGNVIGNTKPDLVIGAPARQIGDDVDAGACFVMRGSIEGLTTSGAVILDAGMADEATPYSDFGATLAVGPFHGPSAYDMIAIGEPGCEVNGMERAGRVHTIWGSEGGPDLSRTALHTQDMYLGSVLWNDQFGSALASGYFGGDHLSEELFIGAPLDFEGDNRDSGSWLLLFGGPSGLGNHGYYVHFGQEYLGDVTEERDRLGAAGVIGDFDGWGRGNLAVSAIGENSSTGLVHIVAPWRQPNDYHSKGALAVDCEGDFIFSQKPFDRLPMANTSIIMAALIACERTQLHPSDPDYISANTPIIVPEWAAGASPGHNYLEAGETIRYVDLIRVALMELGGDAVLTLADVFYPGLGYSAQFSLKAEMNERAQQMGLYDTYFDTPVLFNANEDYGDAEDHYTTAYDLYLLSKEAQANPLFAEYANLDRVQIQRQLEDESPSLWYLNNWFLVGMRNSVETANGLKRGWTEDSGMATAFSAAGYLDNAYVTTLGTPDGGGYGRTAIDLMHLALNRCFQQWEATLHNVWDRRIYSMFEPVLATQNTGYGISGTYMTLSGNMDMDIYPAPGGSAPETRGLIKIRRSSQHKLVPGSPAVLGIEPMEQDLGTRVTNTSDGRIVLDLDTGERLILGEGDSAMLPPKQDGGRWEISTVTNTTADVLIEECYAFDFYHEFGQGEPGRPVFSARLLRETEASEDIFQFSIDWLSDGGEFVFGVRDSDAASGLPWDATSEHSLGRDPKMPSASLSVLTTNVGPNPFADHIEFSLSGTGSSAPEIGIYDSSGRRVTTLRSGSGSSSGSGGAGGEATMSWNGRSETGENVPPGVYFYQVRHEGRTAAQGRIVRVK